MGRYGATVMKLFGKRIEEVTLYIANNLPFNSNTWTYTGSTVCEMVKMTIVPLNSIR